MKALVFGVEKWLGIARIPKLLRDAGFKVAVLSRPETYLAATRHADAHFTMNVVDGPHILSSLAKVIDEWGAQTIVPGDESVLSMLHQIVRADEAGRPTSLSTKVLETVRRSLPPSQYFDATTQKKAFTDLCRELGIRVPETRRAFTMAELLGFAEERGYPVVVKTDEGIGGTGVHIARDEDSLAKAGFATLAQFTSHGRRTAAVPVDIQEYVQGPVCNVVSVAWEGRTLACTAAVKIRCNPPGTGPSSVLRFVDHPEAEEFARAFLSRTRFTGFSSFDYIFEESSGSCCFIESNPRPVASHAAAIHAGVDMGAALYAQTTGAPLPRFFLKEGQEVALYPQETVRDPQSEFLSSAVHDVPSDDPELIAAYEAYIAEVKAGPNG